MSSPYSGATGASAAGYPDPNAAYQDPNQANYAVTPEA
jgi:hypothetical protein